MGCLGGCFFFGGCFGGAARAARVGGCVVVCGGGCAVVCRVARRGRGAFGEGGGRKNKGNLFLKVYLWPTGPETEQMRVFANKKLTDWSGSWIGRSQPIQEWY